MFMFPGFARRTVTGSFKLLNERLTPHPFEGPPHA